MRLIFDGAVCELPYKPQGLVKVDDVVEYIIKVNSV